MCGTHLIACRCVPHLDGRVGDDLFGHEHGQVGPEGQQREEGMQPRVLEGAAARQGGGSAHKGIRAHHQQQHGHGQDAVLHAQERQVHLKIHSENTQG